MPIDKESIDRIIKENETHSCPDHKETCVRIVAIANLPTRFGDFQAVAFQNDFDNKDHAAFIRGNVLETEDVPVRIHSECLTGDAIGSLRCDCREQLETSLAMLGKMEKGILLYLRQEGRGIGLTNKIRAYQLQDQGHDTFEANRILGFRDDERDYAIAAHMLWSLKVKSIKLITNNPDKIKNLSSYGVKITGRIPIIVKPNQYNSFYLETKKIKGGHLLDENVKEKFTEQDDDLLNYIDGGL